MKKILLLMIAIFIYANDYVTLNFKNLKISDFVKMVAKIEHKNILVANDVKGKINFISVRPIKKSNLLNLLIAILKTKGYTLTSTPQGYMKIVRSSDAIRNNPFLNEKSNALIKVQTIHLDNVNVNEVAGRFRKFLSKYGNLITDKNKNDLVIVDYPQNIDALVKVLKEVDSKNKKEFKFIKLKYTKVREIYPKIRNMVNNLFDQRIIKNKVDIISDNNSNTLIFISHKDKLKKIIPLVKKLDVKEQLTEPVTKVVFIKNSNANDIARILTNIYNRKKYTRDDFKPSFTVNKELNAIVVLSTLDTFKEIQELVKSLDIEKPQVYVKAMILEISKNKIRDLGSELGLEGGAFTGNGLYTMAAKLGGPAIAISDTLASGLNGNINNIKQGLALGATLHLLNSTGSAKILSSPSVICLNNKPSTIYIGKTVSILVSSLSGSSSTSETKNSYKRENIGLTLKVTPRISADNKVNLDVKLIAEEAQGTINSDKPITSKRELTTNAIVKTGESVILGGLSKQTLYTSENKVPLLGDIPLLGWLFKYKNTQKDDVDLMILITPYIINKSSDLNEFKQKLAQYNILQSEYNKMIDKKYKKILKNDKSKDLNKNESKQNNPLPGFDG
jgi:general secretion pathway protein D